MLKLARKNEGPRYATGNLQIAFTFQASSKVTVSLELLTAQAISRL